jgi:hypothetical protein
VNSRLVPPHATYAAGTRGSRQAFAEATVCGQCEPLVVVEAVAGSSPVAHLTRNPLVKRVGVLSARCAARLAKLLKSGLSPIPSRKPSRPVAGLPAKSEEAPQPGASPERERLIGFERTTFCMASSRCFPRLDRRSPANTRVPQVGGSLWDSPAFTARSRGFGHPTTRLMPLRSAHPRLDDPSTAIAFGATDEPGDDAGEHRRQPPPAGTHGRGRLPDGPR